MTWLQMESEVNDMSPKNDFSDIFDDDFEVTYEEDPVYDEDDFDNGKFYETDDSDEDDSEENYFEEEYPGDEYPDEGAENEYDDAIYSPSDRNQRAYLCDCKGARKTMMVHTEVSVNSKERQKNGLYCKSHGGRCPDPGFCCNNKGFNGTCKTGS